MANEFNFESVWLSAESQRAVHWANDLMEGEFSGDLRTYEEVHNLVPIPNSEGESDPSDGVMLDLNDTRKTESELEEIKSFLQKRLGESFEGAPISGKFISPDGDTTFRVYSKMFGTEENPWYLSEWQNKGEKPSYILWSQDMYDVQEMYGYERIDSES